LLSQGVPMITAGDECRRTQGGNNNAWCHDNETSWVDWRLVEGNAELVRFVSMLTALRKAEPTLRQRTFLSGKPRTTENLADVSWYGPNGETAAWGNLKSCLACVLAAAPPEVDAALAKVLEISSAAATSGKRSARSLFKRTKGGTSSTASATALIAPEPNTIAGPAKVPHDVMIFTNASGKSQPFQVPPTVKSDRWRIVIDTSAAAPNDILQVPKTSGEARTIDNEAIDRAPVAKFPLIVDAHSLICLMARPA
jgi:pullulanase/glycogen debranching enzyme